MTKIEVTQGEANVKFFNPLKGFGFFKTPEFGDVFVHISKLGTFQPWELQEDAPAVISYATGDNGKLQVTEIHNIVLVYVKGQGDNFSLPRPADFEMPVVAPVPTKSAALKKGDTAVGVVYNTREGFGFLKVEDVNRPIFFHHTQLPTGMKAEMGQVYNFTVDENEKGLVATKLKLASIVREESEQVSTVEAPAEAPKPRLVRTRKSAAREQMAAE